MVKKKILSVILSVMVSVTMTSVSIYAVEQDGSESDVSDNVATEYAASIENIELNGEETLELIEELADDEAIAEISAEGDSFVTKEAEGIDIPASGDDKLLMEVVDGEGNPVDIEMGLPSEIETSDGKLIDSNTVVYEGINEDVNVAAQCLEEEGVLIGGRVLVTIENAEAPKEYSYDFDYPEGYSLIKDIEYDEGERHEDINAVYVVDENNEIVEVLNPAWAKDPNGNTVETHYEINGNTLTQCVEFDENTAFPVVADPEFTTYKKYMRTISGTEYNSSKTKKCVWSADVYNVYAKNVGTGSLHYRHKEYRWKWKGYKKSNGKWKYVKSKSGTTVTHPDWMGVLGEF